MEHPVVVRVAVLAAALLTAALVALAAAAPAAAHAVLVSSAPADSSSLDAAPTEVVLQFNEPVEPVAGAVQVLDGDGQRVDLDDAEQTAPETLRVSLAPDLPDGQYTVSWRVVSADTHPVGGAFVFAVGEVVERAAAPAGLPGSAERTGWDTLAALGRWVLYVAVLLAAGGAVFLSAVHDRRPDEVGVLGRIVGAAAIVAAVATVLSIPLQSAVLTGDAAALADRDALAEVLSSNFGTSALVRLNGLGLLLVGITRLGSPRALGLAVLGGVVALASFLLAGHTAVTEPRWLVLAANAAHTVTAAGWFGGLVLLAVTLRRRRAGGDALGGAAMVARFSGLAVLLVAVAVVAGGALAWAEVRSPAALTGTTYGLLLVVKVALVAVLLGIGAYNNRRLVPAVRRAQGEAWQRLARTVRVEIAGLLAVLAATAFLVAIAPAREAFDPRFTGEVALNEDTQVDLVVDPSTSGTNDVHVYLRPGTVPPAFEPRTVALRFSLPDADVAPIDREALRVGPGHYRHAGPELSIPGSWRVEVAVRVSDFERLSGATEVPIRG